MQTLADLTVDQILLFLLAFARVATLYALFPVVGSRNTPVLVKAGFALITSAILFPLLPRTVVALPTGIFSFAVLAAKEVLVGMVLGFGAGMLFAAIQFAGKQVDHQMGFAISEVLDPLSEESVTLIAQFKIILFTIVFLLLDGHRILLQGLAYTFEAIPLCGMTFDGPVAWKLLRMTGEVFTAGVKLAAPVMITLIIVHAGLGIIARTVPQMNIFIVGMPLNIGVGLLLLAAAFPVLTALFGRMVSGMTDDFYTLVQLMS